MCARKSPLREYLYVDNKRLESYFDQISAPLKYDKVPVWTAGLSLTGPEAGATQSRHARAFTREEKVRALLDHLQQHDQVSTDPGRLTPFILETITSTRIQIPPQERVPAFPGLMIWISISKDANLSRPGDLYLLEDFARSDEDPYGYTSYSTLAMLLDQVKGLGDSLLGSESRLNLHRPTDELERQFARDPLALLKQLGARVGATRVITSLYRVRATFHDPETPIGYNTIAYPIVITEGDRSLTP